jgi:hypothetical protein
MICPNCTDSNGCIGVVSERVRSSHRDVVFQLHSRGELSELREFDTVVQVACNKFHDGDIGFFAAAPISHDEFTSLAAPPSADEAYARAQYGLSRFSGGVMRVKLYTPQCYSEDGRVWPRHFHFLYLKGSNRQLFTARISPGQNGNVTVESNPESAYSCCIGLKEMRHIDPGCCFLVNALRPDAPNLQIANFNFLRAPHEESLEDLRSRLLCVSTTAPLIVFGDGRAPLETIQKLGEIGFHRTILYTGGEDSLVFHIPVPARIGPDRWMSSFLRFLGLRSR